ncbi:hypothetical protein Tco_0791770 [Tanacetum coccineum]
MAFSIPLSSRVISNFLEGSLLMMAESSGSEGWWAYFSSSEGASPSPSSSRAAPHGGNHASISAEGAASPGHPAYDPDERVGGDSILDIQMRLLASKPSPYLVSENNVSIGDIYNSIDSCQTSRERWLRVECLMQGTALTVVDKETRFNNEFDQFIIEPRESLVSVYNHFVQPMNDLKQNKIDLPIVTINTKFLNCLQLKWLKYVTSVRLAKDLTKFPYDDFFDYLQQYEKIIDPEDPLTLAMMLLARAITHRYSTPTNNQLRSSLNTRNQAVVQADKVNIQSRNVGNYVRKVTMLVILSNEQNDFLLVDVVQMEELEELSANICMMAIIQPINIDSDEGSSCDSAFISDIQTPSTSYMNPLFTDRNREQTYHEQPKIINSIIGDDQINSNIIFYDPNVKVNIGNVGHDKHVHDSYKLEQLGRNAYKEAEKQQIIANKVKQQNVELTK